MARQALDGGSATVLTPEEKLTQFQEVVTTAGGTPTETVTAQTFGAEYPTARIYDRNGTLKTVFTSGPNAGRTAEGELVIQGEAPVGGGIAGQGGGDQVPTDAGMQDAYQRLYDEFNKIGLGALVAEGKELLMSATNPAAMPSALRETKAYKTRFSANDARIKAGLSALSPAEYLAKENAYQNLMRNYGLPTSYYTPGTYGKQEGFDKLIANDVSATELENRILVAQDRVLNAPPGVLESIKTYYPEITNADILAYTLNPENALSSIQRKVTTAEIGGAALAGKQKLGFEQAQKLEQAGITGAEAQTGFMNTAQQQQLTQKLPGDVSGAVTQEELVNAQFNLSPEALAKTRKVAGTRAAEYQGGGQYVTSQAGVTGIGAAPQV